MVIKERLCKKIRETKTQYLFFQIIPGTETGRAYRLNNLQRN